MAEGRSTRLFVGNLNEAVNSEDIKREFAKYGTVKSVWVAFNPKGFAIVDYESRNEAEKACEALNGHDALGTTLGINIVEGRESVHDSD